MCPDQFKHVLPKTGHRNFVAVIQLAVFSEVPASFQPTCTGWTRYVLQFNKTKSIKDSWPPAMQQHVEELCSHSLASTRPRLCPINQIIPSVLVFNWKFGSPIASKVIAASVLPSLIPVKLFTYIKNHKHINQKSSYPYSKSIWHYHQYSEVHIFFNWPYLWIKMLVDKQPFSSSKFKLLLEHCTAMWLPLTGILDTGGKVLAAEACPGHSQFQITHCRTQLSLSASIVAPWKHTLRKGEMYISVASSQEICEQNCIVSTFVHFWILMYDCFLKYKEKQYQNSI